MLAVTFIPHEDSNEGEDGLEDDRKNEDGEEGEEGEEEMMRKKVQDILL